MTAYLKIPTPQSNLFKPTLPALWEDGEYCSDGVNLSCHKLCWCSPHSPQLRRFLPAADPVIYGCERCSVLLSSSFHLWLQLIHGLYQNKSPSVCYEWLLSDQLNKSVLTDLSHITLSKPWGALQGLRDDPLYYWAAAIQCLSCKCEVHGAK